MPTSVKKLGLNRDNNISQCSLLEHIMSPSMSGNILRASQCMSGGGGSIGFVGLIQNDKILIGNRQFELKMIKKRALIVKSGLISPLQQRRKGKQRATQLKKSEIGITNVNAMYLPT